MEACQSGRMGLTANELSPFKGTGGSNPLASAGPFRGTQLKTSARSSTDRASDYGSEGWEFESLRARSAQRLFSASGGLAVGTLTTVLTTVGSAATGVRFRYCARPGGAARSTAQRGERVLHFRTVTFVAGSPPLFVHVEVVEEREPTSDSGFPVRDVDGPG